MDLVLLGTAFALGAVHTFEADHMAAVSAFVVRRPRVYEALGYGLRWALGHGGVILLVGTLLVLTRLALPESSGVLLERLVGASMVVLGGWVVLTARRLHAHTHRHDDGTVHTHLHAHDRAVADGTGNRDGGREHAVHVEPHAEPHAHHHAATAMGALHGLAGTAPAVALIPLATLDSVAPAVLYLLFFGIGTALSMGLYAMFAGWITGRASDISGRIGRALARTAGFGSITVGLWWLIR